VHTPSNSQAGLDGVQGTLLERIERRPRPDARSIVITGSGGIVEVQGTAEGKPFSEEEFLTLLRLAKAGVGQLVELQKMAVM